MGFLEENYNIFSILADIFLILWIIFLVLFFLYFSILYLGIAAVLLGVFYIISSLAMGRIGKYYFTFQDYLGFFDNPQQLRKSIWQKNNPALFGIILLVAGLLIIFY